MTTVDKVAEFEDRQRATWAAGDCDRIAELLWPVGGCLVTRLGVAPGGRVLDIGAGTGNAVPAAQAGARAVGLDLTPELFDAGRARAAAAGVEVEWVESDPEALPFADDSFDVVPPPPLRGDEEHVRGLFAGTDFELRFAREEVIYELPSVEHLVELLETWFGPLVKACRELAPHGRWAALRADFAALLDGENTARDGGLIQANEYLVVEGRKQ